MMGKCQKAILKKQLTRINMMPEKLTGQYTAEVAIR